MTRSIFTRYEKKYLLNRIQCRTLQNYLAGRIVPDQYGQYTITNIYYDTEQYDLIRTSIEKPVYKEKLRLRSYGVPNEDSMVFLELKKKYDGVVYKRRVALPYHEAKNVVRDGASLGCQILDEIQYFANLYYPLQEMAYISYDRVAFTGAEDPNLRITFDTNILFRQTDLSLDKGIWGSSVLDQDQVVMEIKIPGVFPMWLSHILSELLIFPTSFSKYGTCYMQNIASGVEKRGAIISA